MCYSNHMKRLLIAIAFIFPSATFAQTVTLPVITGVSTDFISVATEAPYTSTIAVTGTDLDYLLFNPVTITIGPITAMPVGGNDSSIALSFTIDSSLLTERESSFPIVVSQNGETLTQSANLIIFNPFVGEYIPNKPKQFLNSITNLTHATKQTVGLNVHWAQGGNTEDDALYQKRLEDSDTIWVREQFSADLLMGGQSAAWLKRYDQTMLRYRDLGVHVVGMLAYGDTNTAEWAAYIDLVTKRYGSYVDAWEIWNEPDSDTYLQPSNWRTYKPLLFTASPIIRANDPDALVLNGAVADITDTEFIDKLYKYGHKYFDELNIHFYYCEEFKEDHKELTRLQDDFSRVQKIVKRYEKKEPIWVTESGCSTGREGISERLVDRYLRKSTNWLLTQPNIRPLFLYTFRDRNLADAYEAEFGLMDINFKPKLSWRWYKVLPGK